jgi:hypothetical protein
VVISWVAPYLGHTELFSYTVQIQHGDGVNWSTELNHCDGADALIKDATECTIPVGTLRSDPFNI